MGVEVLRQVRDTEGARPLQGYNAANGDFRPVRVNDDGKVQVEATVAASIEGDVVKVNPVVGEKTVTTTAAALFAGVSQLASRRRLQVFNLEDDRVVFVGPPTVTAQNGYPIQPSEGVMFSFDPTTAIAIYALVDSFPAKVRVMEA